MKKVALIGGFIVLFFVAMFVVASQWPVERKVSPAAASPSAITPSGITPSTAPATDQPGFLYGRVTLVGGDTLEGRLRWGRGEEEAFWGDFFNGVKVKNLWAPQVPAEQLPKESHSIEIFGMEFVHRERTIDLGRRFLVRFGDITRIEAHGREVRVILKSGTVFDLDRFDSSDFDDDLRVWDSTRGVVDLDSTQISAIELLPTAPLADAPGRLHGTVHTPEGDFTGFIQWNLSAGTGTDEFVGRNAEGDLHLRFDTIRSIARRSGGGSTVTLLDGRTIEIARHGNRGILVEDPRYGRVLISWKAFERVDFSPGSTGPAYGDFPPGSPLKGTVTTRDGRRLAGRLVFDLDESETTETLDGPIGDVDYTIPFGMVASIVPPGREGGGAKLARVTLQNGEQLQLERGGDFGDRNAGMLVFVDGGPTPEYVLWGDLARVDFDRPSAMYPPPQTKSTTKKE